MPAKLPSGGLWAETEPQGPIHLGLQQPDSPAAPRPYKDHPLPPGPSAWSTRSGQSDSAGPGSGESIGGKSRCFLSWKKRPMTQRQDCDSGQRVSVGEPSAESFAGTPYVTALRGCRKMLDQEG